MVGDVVLPDGLSHALIWQNGVVTDRLPGDFQSIGVSVNNKGQVVGNSAGINDADRTGFLWQNGVMTDLNTLIPADSPLFLFDASGNQFSRRDRRLGCQEKHRRFTRLFGAPSNGEATSATATARGETTERLKFVLPKNVRKLLRQRMGFGITFAASEPRQWISCCVPESCRGTVCFH